jgi:periplasmic protein TonB
VTRSALVPAFLTAVLLHMAGLLGLSFLWGFLQVASPTPTPIQTEVVVVDAPASLPEPVPLAEVEPLTPPTVLTQPDARPAPSPPAAEPLAPAKVEPLTPPKAVERPPPKRAEPRPKPVPAVKRPPAPTDALPPGAPPGPKTPVDKPKPGPQVSLPDEGPTAARANALGPSTAMHAAEPAAKSVEGGEAGAGELSARGDLPVVPGSGVGGGSGGPGRAGLGWATEGGGARMGGARPGPGGDGSGEGAGGLSLPSGGYQVKPRYPDSARRQGIEGTVSLKVRVTERGTVEEVQVEQSAGYPDLDRAAVEAVRRWRFSPARQGNQPMAIWVLIPVTFRLE